jgi:hypothetical protein
MENCRNCNFGEHVDGDFYRCLIGRWIQCAQSDYYKWQPKEAEDKTYTTGQMIDIILAGRIEELEAKTDCNAATIILCGDDLHWCNNGTKELATTLTSTMYSNSRWTIRKRKPKRTYKDVLLEKFPKGDVETITYIHCPSLFFGCIDDVTWVDEYKEEEGETDEG